MEESISVKVVELPDGTFTLANDQKGDSQLPSCLTEHDYLGTSRLDPKKIKQVQTLPRSVVAEILETWRSDATRNSSVGFETQQEGLEAKDKIRALLPPNYNYYFQQWDYQNDVQYSCVFRIKEVKSKEMAEQWMKEYREIGSTIWRLRKTYPGAGLRNLFKIDLKCQHNTDKRIGKTPHKTRVSKNTNCQAKLQLIIRRYIKHSRAKKPDTLVAEWPCIIYLDHVHNHFVDKVPSASSLLEPPLVYKIFSVNLSNGESIVSDAIDEASNPREELEIPKTKRKHVAVSPVLQSMTTKQNKLLVRRFRQKTDAIINTCVQPSNSEKLVDSVNDDSNEEEEEVCCPCRKKCSCHCHSASLVLSHELHDYAVVIPEESKSVSASTVKTGISVKKKVEDEPQVEMNWSNGNEDMAEFMYYFGIKAKQGDVT